MSDAFLLGGIDYSTTSGVDIVTLPWEEDADTAHWRHYELHGINAFEKARNLPLLLSGTEWDDVRMVYVERPYSQNFGTVAALMRLQGAVLARLPKRLVVSEISAQDWKRIFCGKAGASKDEVAERARELGFDPDGATEHCFDAYAIAFAAREENRRAVANEAVA